MDEPSPSLRRESLRNRSCNMQISLFPRLFLLLSCFALLVSRALFSASLSLLLGQSLYQTQCISPFSLLLSLFSLLLSFSICLSLISSFPLAASRHLDPTHFVFLTSLSVLSFSLSISLSLSLSLSFSHTYSLTRSDSLHLYHSRTTRGQHQSHRTTKNMDEPLQNLPQPCAHNSTTTYGGLHITSCPR